MVVLSATSHLFWRRYHIGRDQPKDAEPAGVIQTISRLPTTQVVNLLANATFKYCRTTEGRSHTQIYAEH